MPSYLEIYVMPQVAYTPAEVARRGQEIYDQTLRDKVEQSNLGHFLVIDIRTGAYEIADDDLTASNRALAKDPEAVLYGLRIGYSTAYRLGGRFMVKSP